MTAPLELLFRVLDRGLVPDPVLRAVIRRLCAERLREQGAGGVEAQQERKRAFLQERAAGPIARHSGAANRQHYEVPAAFYERVLGPRRKYSCCYYPSGVRSLAAAEEAMLALTCERAQVQDGQRILDLGCGWGALALWLCERYPHARVTALSNSASQRRYIEEQARRRGLGGLTVLTHDVNELPVLGPFDRVLSVEMFEHVWNTDALLTRLSAMLAPGGRLFLHVFAHRCFAYPYEDRGQDDWMARTFFTGGTMPSDDLLLQARAPLQVEDHWALDGTHYARTAEDWLRQFDGAREALRPVLAATYGAAEVPRWISNWRLFFLAVAEMFAYDNGQQWGVSHYRFRPSAP